MVRNALDIVPSDPTELLRQVQSQDGKVPAAVANAFVNKVLYGAYQPQDLAGLTDEHKVSLYEAVATAKYDSAQSRANYKNPPLNNLDALNKAMGRPTRAVDQAMVAVMKDFNSPQGRAETEKLWISTGHQAAFGCTFQQALDQNLLGFNNASASLQDERAQLFTVFYAEAVDAHVQKNAAAFGLGEQDLQGVTCQLIEAEKGLCGGHGRHDGQSYLSINVNSQLLDGNFPEVVDTAWHEEHHEVQGALARAYEAGRIPEGHALNHAARIYAANRDSYIRANGTQEADAAYMNQPMEAGAWSVGAVAKREAQTRLRNLQAEQRPAMTASHDSDGPALSSKRHMTVVAFPGAVNTGANTVAMRTANNAAKAPEYNTAPALVM